ncbi:hypothetical protein N9A42_00840 [bacterium]|nr:hypothetical protein [bacterium]
MNKVKRKQYTVTITDSDETISLYELGNDFQEESKSTQEKEDIQMRYQSINPNLIVTVE